MNRKIRVLMLVPNFSRVNGVVTFAMNYYRSINHEKVKVDFASYDEINADYEFINELEKYHDKLYFLPPVKDIFKHMKYCKELIKKNKYNVIHDNSLINTIPMMMIARDLRIPVRILHAHATKLGETSGKEKRNKLFLPVLKKCVNANFACSHAAGNTLFGNKPYDYVPNVIHGENYFFDLEKRNKIRNQFNVGNKKIVLTVGRIAKQKNPIFAIQVMNIVIKAHPDVIYWWIGNGSEKDLQEVEEYIEKLGLRNNVFLLGKQDNIPEFLNAADCFFLPSLFEGLPVSGVEAQASGLPCIMSDTITKELVYTNNLVDFISLDESKEHWSEKIYSVLSNTIDRDSVISDFNNSNFSDKNAGKLLYLLYEKYLNIL